MRVSHHAGCWKSCGEESDVVEHFAANGVVGKRLECVLAKVGNEQHPVDISNGLLSNMCTKTRNLTCLSCSREAINFVDLKKEQQTKHVLSGMLKWLKITFTHRHYNELEHTVTTGGGGTIIESMKNQFCNTPRLTHSLCSCATIADAWRDRSRRVITKSASKSASNSVEISMKG